MALPRLPQDRLHHAPQADRVPLGLLPLVRGRARLFDEGRTRGIGGTVDWARLEAEAGKMIESALEHADSIEAALDINRVPDSRTPGCLA